MAVTIAKMEVNKKLWVSVIELSSRQTRKYQDKRYIATHMFGLSSTTPT